MRTSRLSPVCAGGLQLGWAKREAHSLSGCLTPFSGAPTLRETDAGVAELADAQDSGSCGGYTSCGFKSLLRYQRRRGPLDPFFFGVGSRPDPPEFATFVGANSQAVRRAPRGLRTAWVHKSLLRYQEDRGPWVSWAPVLWPRGAASSAWSSRPLTRRTLQPHRARPGLQVPPPVPAWDGVLRPRTGGLFFWDGSRGRGWRSRAVPPTSQAGWLASIPLRSACGRPGGRATTSGRKKTPPIREERRTHRLPARRSAVPCLHGFPPTQR